jgi:NAD(P)-dependent dehydrogenase (short-subunit alcohol dehydrogenase family)
MGSKRLEGKRAVITGAAGGIARATALAFAAQGAIVSLADQDQAGVEKAVAKVVSQRAKAKAFVTDVTSRKAVQSLMTGADAFMGGIDILVTCAGGYKAYAGFEEISEADWDRVIDVNLKSVYLCCKAVLPFMKTGGWGRIINLGSLAGRSTSAGTSPAHYASAKAAVSMMTQYLAKDIGSYNITANTIAPGTTMTDRVKKMLTPEKKEMFTKACPLGRLAQPEEISDVITFLASDESRYITGATIDVNGGRLMLV